MSNKGSNNLLELDKTYLTLDEIFYSLQVPQPVKEPSIFCYNKELAKKLNIGLSENEIIDYFSGNKIIPNTKPFAQAYAGHQFGYFTILGDGRAIILGEIRFKDKLYDIQLKGSGRTPYSRGGDGRATLPTMLREYLISEAMHNLKIPTTRSLCIIETKDKVYRQTEQSGAVLTRIAQSHIRIGTFEYASLMGIKQLKQLLNYTIERHYPELKNDNNPAKALLKKVMDKQIKLIVEWLRVGFIHGVMNTDNTSISGETIDYGPCAFMNSYDEKKVYSSIDAQGRYSFGNQANIIKWNIVKLAEALLSLICENEEESIKIAEEIISGFNEKYQNAYITMMSKKLGLLSKKEGDLQLINELLTLMRKYKRDYTNTFFKLSNNENPFTEVEERDWFIRWKERIEKQDQIKTEKVMQNTNPALIPRNHHVEKAIRDKTEFESLLQALKNPYDHENVNKEFQKPPESEIGYKTYCGT
ncbi:MAG TPA: YdiU family protein [Methanofastidiosum sp.]|nr:YdiU family protein [Methanofastidiosum sp.]HNU61362.1 YdiU family protein [Methanofastidiosum sp.]